jgi:hypothetical protein
LLSNNKINNEIITDNSYCQDNQTSNFLVASDQTLPTSTGVLIYGVRTLELCKQSCLNYVSSATQQPCVRFTFNANQYASDPNSLCYLYTTTTDVATSASGVSLYLRKFCISLSPATTLR